MASITLYVTESQPQQVPDPPPGGCRSIFPATRGPTRPVKLTLPSGASLPLSMSATGRDGSQGFCGLSLGPALFGSGHPAVELPPYSSITVIDCSCPR